MSEGIAEDDHYLHSLFAAADIEVAVVAFEVAHVDAVVPELHRWEVADIGIADDAQLGCSVI